MALSKGINSYATVAEADTYFEDRLDASGWTSADATQKAQALVTATATLDELNWIGIAISDSQALAFPRNGEYFDPRKGTVVTLSSTTVPSRIITATFELAFHLLSNDNVLDDTGTVTNLVVGSISLTDIRKPSKTPPQVKRIIKPLLLNGGSNTWWRAN